MYAPISKGFRRADSRAVQTDPPRRHLGLPTSPTTTPACPKRIQTQSTASSHQ
ncbi:hypothetical protein K505DRAFT_321597 [Melanomma pulvis-pyrius CBS 109.77]|uniref:Uncharacterized protein n=1 Tax=Melanomma pulvis-pyrius CBS 109.77 TaxID=1314802 RepID=A0A6A6XQE2_9PLEO|nr:hypothetical protein K505DRAFT_321597 [Melanomma pulvis-pyrius CBS 109.77]